MPALIVGAVIAGFAAFGVGTLVRAVPVSDAERAGRIRGRRDRRAASRTS